MHTPVPPRATQAPSRPKMPARGRPTPAAQAGPAAGVVTAAATNPAVEPDKVGSRERIFEAALDEFSVRGFDGARVDRIARAAGLNKAMLYYHFGSKEQLFQATVQQLLGRLADHLEVVSNGPLPPPAKLHAFIENLIGLGLGEPRFTQTMLREVAAGGTRIDEGTIRHMLRLVNAMATIVAEGQRSGDFRDLSPILVYLTAVWPILVYSAIQPLRPRMARYIPEGSAHLDSDAFTRHMKELVSRSLAIEPAIPRRARVVSRNTEQPS